MYDTSEAFLEPYIRRFSAMKAMGGVYRFIGKLFINSLYGRFGLKRNDQTTILTSLGEEQYYSNRFHIYDRLDLENGYILLTYSPKPVLEKYKLAGIYHSYKNDIQSYKKSYKFTESNVAIAAAITAVGRMRLYEDMVSVQKNGGKIAYCDTDSIFAQFDHSNTLGKTYGNVYYNPDLEETTFSEGVFLAPKMYAIKDRLTHIKGAPLNRVTFEEMKNLYIEKAANVAIDDITIFARKNLDIIKQSQNKVYSLWASDKRK